jgi:hypothetical protein
MGRSAARTASCRSNKCRRPTIGNSAFTRRIPRERPPARTTAESLTAREIEKTRQAGNDAVKKPVATLGDRSSRRSKCFSVSDP